MPLSAVGNLTADDLSYERFEEANVGMRKALRRAGASRVSWVRCRRCTLDLAVGTEHIVVPRGHIFALLGHNIGMISAD